MEKEAYYPVQIPYVLNKEYSEYIEYTEELLPQYSDFVICFWEMKSRIQQEKTIKNIIITDGCIDLVAEYNSKRIGFAGMSKTEFDYKITLPAHCFGTRFKAGAFFAITGISAKKVMDNFISLDAIDTNFNTELFFSQPVETAKSFFKNYIGSLLLGKKPSVFLTLFDRYSVAVPDKTSELCKELFYSQRQCQRYFEKHFGLSPQMVLCILRFQKCLRVLTSGKAKQSDIVGLINYYDQAHFIKDFKKNIGITPFELSRLYKE